MNTIHMDTDQVRETSRQLLQLSESIKELVGGMENVVNSLDWQGQSREEFLFEFERCLKAILLKAEEGSALGTRVEKEAEEWEAADRNSSAGFGAGKYSLSANHLSAQVLGLSILPATGGAALIYPSYKLQPGPAGNKFYQNEDYLGTEKYDALVLERQEEIQADQSSLEDIEKRIIGLNSMKQQNQALLDEVEAELTPPKRWLNDLLGLTDSYQATKEQLLQTNAQIDGLIKKYGLQKGALTDRIGSLSNEIQQFQSDKPHPPVNGSAQLSPARNPPVHISGGNRGVSLDITPNNGGNPEVQSIRSGKIIYAGTERDDKGNITGYGNYVKVLQDDGVVVLYGHLKDVPPVSTGSPVKAGETIGTMGSTGNSTGTHLHLEFRTPVNSDPQKYTTDSGDLVTKYQNGGFDPKEYLKVNGCNL